MKKVCRTLVLIASFLTLTFPAFAQAIDPQYIFVRKDNTCSNCYNWNGFNPDVINLDAVNEIYSAIGTKGTDARKLGIGVLFFYNGIPLPNLKASLQRLLDFSRIHEFPVFIGLDGYQWWDNRPDLWNWFDPGAPGYNPANRNNVEWTCPDPSCALRKAWRNWGSELVVKPGPNIASRQFIDANKQSLSELLPIISDWYAGLPGDKKWLLGGIDLGTEIDVGGNYYYYTNGTAGGNKSPIGFAAVSTLGLAGGVTAANKNEIVRRYVNELDEFAATKGIPRSKIFNHIHPDQAAAAVTGSGYPGWSLYSPHSDHPNQLPGLDAALNQANSEWASPEWLTGSTTKNGWIAALDATLTYRHNKFLNVANWEQTRSKPYALEAIRSVLNEQIAVTYLPTGTATRIPVPGDFTGDGHVTQEDFSLIRSKFGSPYTIFDYNAVVTNFMK